jgi:hypothetical protein
MTPARTWAYLGPAVALAGLILFTIYAPRARAAETMYAFANRKAELPEALASTGK